ncbi:MAG: hypothetical protein K2X73_04780 [Sphingomonas sp.]|uniref:phage tail tube protein n=1 Tax=Sphingomonas sp. TaxID=28214 RepID=UPI0025ED8F17|nr:phage tail tube protein [Sphingomonas sp.]MBX9881269.1 hypothetical protein [Sphingomonas sp.]
MEDNKLLLFKKEGVYATDSAPTLAANAVLTRNFTSKPIAADRIQRTLDRPVRGRTKDGTSNERTTFSYEIELAGSGAAGTAPGWMEHLEACGMLAPTLTAGQDAVQRFAPVGAALSSATAWYYRGSLLEKAVGSRGTFSLDFTAGAYPFAKFDMTGLLGAVPFTDLAPAAPTLDRWKDPVEVNTDNTDVLIGGYAVVLRSLTIDANADIAVRNLVNGRYIQRGNHAATGRTVFELPTIGARNYFADLRANAEIALSVVHGIAAGNIVQLDASRLQVTDIELGEQNNVLEATMTFGLNVGATNDDLVITAK